MIGFLKGGMAKYAAAALVVLGLPAAGYIKGRADGAAAVLSKQAAAISRLQSDLEEVTARSKARAAELIKAEEKAHALANELEETARAAPNAARRALDAGSVQRIFSR